KEGSPARASPSAGTTVAGRGNGSGVLEYRGLDDAFSQPFQVKNGQGALGPVGTREDLAVGCHPNRGATSAWPGKTLDAKHRGQNGFGGGYQARRLRELLEPQPELLIADAKPVGLRGLVDVHPQVGTESGGNLGECGELVVI